MEHAIARRAATVTPFRWNRAGAIVILLLVCTLFLFVDTIPVAPVALWDEGRNANNAIEMVITGFSLVTTYDFQPDLWNTKPPLLIWLMSGSMMLFGPSEWALRLPSALAALGTLLCLALFVRKATASAPLAFGASLLLLLSPGFFGEHGARTAEYDATLLFFVTCGVQLLFLAVHRSKPSWALVAGAGAMIALGALTKSVAAFIPVVGVLTNALLSRRFGRLLRRWPRYFVAGTTALLPLLLFVWAREAASPGYVAAALYNDVLGRFNEQLIPGETGPAYYVVELVRGWFFAGPFLLALPLALRWTKGRERVLLLYSLSVAGTALLVYSAASTRAMQYALPVFPWLAIAAAIILRHLILRFVVAPWRADRRATAALIGGGMLLVLVQLGERAAYWRYDGFPSRQFYPVASYGMLFEELAARGLKGITVIDPGVHLPVAHYTPLLRWNRSVWQLKGFEAAHQPVLDRRVQGPVASCDPNVYRLWAGLPGKERIGLCAILWRPA